MVCGCIKGRYYFMLFGLLVGSLLLSGCVNTTKPAAGVLGIVAAENFYGDLARQLGGSHVSVTSILSDPNVDPHTYQSNVQTGITVSQASLVIENGGGYDDWMDKILASTPSSGSLVLKAFDTVPVHNLLPENEHVWYSLTNIVTIAQAITADLKQLDTADAATFAANLQSFEHALQPLQQKVEQIKTRYNGTPVGLTETIYLYQSEPEGLHVLTPFAFAKAVAEGNDPPADAVITATNQINQRLIKVLIYNKQTITPATTSLQNLARTKGIPVVGVTETMPTGKTYQTWMMDQLTAVQTALGG